MSKIQLAAFRRAFLLACALTAMNGTAQALSCPASLPDQTIGSSQGGATLVRRITLRSSWPNPAGTTLLCRYRGEQVQITGTGIESYQKTVGYDRYTTVQADPAQAWVVRFEGLDGRQACSGSAVSPDWVLTARHCSRVEVGGVAIGGIVQQTSVTCGGRACFTVPNPNAQRATVAEIRPAPRGDMMLVRLATPLVLTRYGMPAYGHRFAQPMPGDIRCALGLSSCTRYNGVQYGWGCDNDPSIISCPNGRNELEVIKVKFWANAACGASIAPSRTPRDICSTGGRDGLLQGGNSGGPLTWNGLIVGVTSGTTGQVGAGNMQFANLTESEPWISGIVGVTPPASL
jgi:hypothetical protein